MRIHALTVCVNYSDFLTASLERWKRHLASWTIITDAADEKTATLAVEHDLNLYRTNAFTKAGASFNKGLALEEARLRVAWEDWILIIDADIVPERNWFDIIRAVEPQPGNLYGAWRLNANSEAQIDDLSVPRIKDDRVGYGYFQLFHSSDLRVKNRTPLFSTHWRHAGNCDSDFMQLWPRAVELPLKLWHIGERENWYGRGKHEEFRQMQQTRLHQGGGISPTERVDLNA